MATIKSFTSLEQSRKLAEILPLESADMFYADLFIDNKHKYIVHLFESYGFKTFKDTNKRTSQKLNFIPCWSLASLLGVLPNYEINNFGDGIQLSVNNKALVTENDETLLDLVVNMIIYLHELKML